MQQNIEATILGLTLLLTGCTSAPTHPLASATHLLDFALLSGEAAVEPAYVRFALEDKTHGKYSAQALPGVWGSATIRLHSVAGATLTEDRYSTLNHADADGFNNTDSKTAVFTHLRPGNYVFQVALFSGANGSGTSVGVHTIDLNLAGGSTTGITMTMKTTDGEGANGGTKINTNVSDINGYIRSGNTYKNSVLGGGGTPVIVAGDTLILDPLLADSSSTGAVTVVGGSGAANNVSLEAGVLSRVLVTYANKDVTPTTANLEAGETILTDWVRTGNEPIRGSAWTTLADGNDNNTWPARGAAIRTGAGTFAGSFNWTTTDAGTFPNPLPFTDESALATNYRLIYRYYDNTYSHNLIAIKTQNLAVVKPASIDLTVQ